MELTHLTKIILFALIMCADITITHVNMKKYRQLKPKTYWRDEHNPILRWFYKSFSMPVAFTLSLIYVLPWLIILYYLFNKNQFLFIIASAVYGIAFIAHYVMARHIAKEINYSLMLKEAHVDHLKIG